jgi:geranylgeranyl transferase type-1 subunit beta
LIQQSKMKDYLTATMTRYGGHGKTVGDPPDLLHSYMGIAALSIGDTPTYQPLDPVLNMSKRAVQWMKNHNVFYSVEK